MHMNRTGSLTLLLAVALQTSASAAPQQRRQVSLKEALQLAAKQGPDVAAARAQGAGAHAGVDRAWTAWQPNIAANGTYDHTNGFATLDFSGLGKLLGNVCVNFPVLCTGVAPAAFAGPSQKTRIIGQNNWYGNIQLTQPLLTPQGLFGPGAAEAGAEAADRGADEAREQVLLGVARAYYGLQ